MYAKQSDIASRGQTPTSASLRQLIDQVLKGDACLEAFCLDYFPRIKQRFSGAMERRIKVSLLLEQTDKNAILDALKDSNPVETQKYVHCLHYEFIEEGILEFTPGDITQKTPKGVFSFFEYLSEAYPMLFHSFMMLLYSLVCWFGYSILIRMTSRSQ